MMNGSDVLMFKLMAFVRRSPYSSGSYSDRVQDRALSAPGAAGLVRRRARGVAPGPARG